MPPAPEESPLDTSANRRRAAHHDLDYFDGVHFGQRATAPALFSVGLMDPICPPSTVYAAFNHYAAQTGASPSGPSVTVADGYGSNPPAQLEWLDGSG